MRRTNAASAKITRTPPTRPDQGLGIMAWEERLGSTDGSSTKGNLKCLLLTTYLNWVCMSSGRENSMNADDINPSLRITGRRLAPSSEPCAGLIGDVLHPCVRAGDGLSSSNVHLCRNYPTQCHLRFAG